MSCDFQCFLVAFSTNDSLYDMIVIETSITVFEIIEKVSFNIASEASYLYILSGQKLLKNAKIGQIGEFLKN